MENIKVSFLLIGIASLVNSYGYKYQYNPFSKECELMLTVPGKGDPITFSGSNTDSRYSENYGAINSQKVENSKVSGSTGYDTDHHDRRPVVSAANSNYNNYYEETAYEKELELERERERERDREREREKIREREQEREREREREKIREREQERERERERESEREREKERESEYASGSSYQQTKKVSSSNIGLENGYPSSSATSVSYEEPFPSSNVNNHNSHSQSHGNRYQGGGDELEQAYVGSSSSSSNSNPYGEPEDVYIEKPQKNSNKNFVEASSNLNKNKQSQEQSFESVQEAGYGGTRVTGTSSINNYNTRNPSSSSIEESSYTGSSSPYGNGNRESTEESGYDGGSHSTKLTSSSLSTSKLCSDSKIYSESLGRCVDKIVTTISSNKKTSSSSSQQANNYNEESTSYVSSSGGASSASLGFGSSDHSGGSIGSIGSASLSSKLADYDFNEAVLLAHNNYRAKHGVKPLVLDEEMSYAAQRHAIKLANGAPFEHSYDAKSGKYGENIALRSEYLSPSAVTNIWYKEHLNYDYSFPQLTYNPNKSNVRFTALVWRGTSKLGVGKATSSDGRTYVVANYWPPGNYESLLTENVFPPIY